MTSDAQLIATRLQAAIALHGSGQLDQAELTYKQILQSQPQHFDALQLLATLAAQRKNSAAAIELFDRALKVNPKHFPSLNNRGVALQDLKRFAEALESFDRAIALKPDYADALNNRGNALRSLGKLDEAVASYDVAIGLQPNNANLFNNRGIALQGLNRNSEAIESYESALKIRPGNAETLNNRGVALHALMRCEAAIESYDQALTIRPAYAEALNNRGNAKRALERHEEAAADYGRALEVDPSHVSTLINFGNTLLDLGRIGEAIEKYDRALTIDRDNANALSNRGNALRALMRLDEALECHDRAVRIDRDNAEAFNNRGNVLRDLRRVAEALMSYDRAIEIKPDFAKAHINRGHVLRELGRDDEALASYDRALRIAPGDAEAHLNRGILLAYMGDRSGALVGCRKSIALVPGYADARWALAMTTIPIVPEQGSDPIAARPEFSRELAALGAWFDSTRLDGHEQIGTMTPFYLAYQEENNRDLLSRYGSLCCALMKRWQDKQQFAFPGSGAGRVKRVGIASAHIKNHSVWNAIVKGWLGSLDRNKIELHLFHLGAERDAETAWAQSHSNSFEGGARTLRDWATAISEKQLDALIYPEIGMDSMTIKLASLRLAPVQIAAWGHPETTGLPTIDYYLSAEAFEPSGAQANYSEKLIALPNLGCSYAPLAVAGSHRYMPGLDVDPDVPILISPGTPFKYAPQNDQVFVDIARQLGKCRIIFFEYKVQALSKVLQRRLEIAFSQSGMRFEDSCVFMPWQSTPDFFALMKRAHVFLDTIGFSGFNTAMQAVECGLPIVTREGNYMRGRLASGILRRMELTELIADTNKRYVDLVVKLARDAGYSQRIRREMATSRHELFDDPRPVQALQAFLEKLG